MALYKYIYYYYYYYNNEKNAMQITHIIRTTHLTFFDHTAHADPSMDHS